MVTSRMLQNLTRPVCNQHWLLLGIYWQYSIFRSGSTCIVSAPKHRAASNMLTAMAKQSSNKYDTLPHAPSCEVYPLQFYECIVLGIPESCRLFGSFQFLWRGPTLWLYMDMSNIKPKMIVDWPDAKHNQATSFWIIYQCNSYSVICNDLHTSLTLRRNGRRDP